MISSYTVQARADIRARLNILGANPTKKPLGPDLTKINLVVDERLE